MAFALRRRSGASSWQMSVRVDGPVRGWRLRVEFHQSQRQSQQRGANGQKRERGDLRPAQRDIRISEPCSATRKNKTKRTTMMTSATTCLSSPICLTRSHRGGAEWAIGDGFGENLTVRCEHIVKPKEGHQDRGDERSADRQERKEARPDDDSPLQFPRLPGIQHERTLAHDCTVRLLTLQICEPHRAFANAGRP